MRRGVRHFLTLALIACALFGCDTSRESSTDGAERSVLRRGIGSYPQTLDPARAEDFHAFEVLSDLYEGLVTIDAGGAVVPGAADSWEVSTDGLTYRFHIDPAARWSNGSKVVAGDFVAGFRRTLSPETGSAYGFLLFPIRNAAGVIDGSADSAMLGITAIGDDTVVIETDEPTPQLLAVLTMPIAFPLWRDERGPDPDPSEPESFVGNGAYVLEEQVPGNLIRASRNPYFRESDDVSIDVVEYHAIADPVAELNRYRSGELDITSSVPGSHYRDLQQTHGDELRTAPMLATYYLAFDVSEPPLDDPSLRQALSMAIDRQALTQILGRGERPAYGFVPDGIFGYTPARLSWAGLSNELRKSRARELFELAVASNARSGQLTLLYDAGDAVHETVALAVRSMWAETLGIEIELEKREWKYFLDTREQRDEWQVMRFAWSGDYNHPGTFTDLLESKNPQNLSGYTNPEYDRLIAAAAQTIGPEAQMQLLHQAEALMLTENPIAPLYFFVSKHLVSPAVSGFHANATDRHLSRYLSLSDNTD